MSKFSEKQLLKIERMRKFLNDFKGSVVLDVGCGPNPLSKEVVEGCVIGLDIQLNRLTEARGAGVEVVLADLNRGIPFKDESFDLIIATGYIPCLIYDTDYLLEEIRRVLKMSGVLIVDVYNICSLVNRFAVGGGKMPFGVEYAKETINGERFSGMIRAFNRDIFVALLKKHQFRVEDVRTDVIHIPKLVRIPWKYRFLVSLGESIIVKCRRIK